MFKNNLASWDQGLWYVHAEDMLNTHAQKQQLAIITFINKKNPFYMSTVMRGTATGDLLHTTDEDF